MRILKRMSGVRARGVELFLLLLSVVIFCASLFLSHNAEVPEGTVYLYFVDVGQGDASFLATDAGSVLIDAGTSGAAPALYQTIRPFGNTLQYLIITHPHDDHMGGASYILEKMDVETVILPVDTSDNVDFQKFLRAVEAEGAEILYAEPDMTVLVEEVTFTFLAPLADTGDANENSTILRMDRGSFSVLFTGDAGIVSEKIQLAEYGDEPGGLLDTDVLKVGHHGSDSSSTAAYLSAVTPHFAIISCGEDNSYGHPDPDVLSRLEAAEATVYRTDKSGTVILEIDSETIAVKGLAG